MQNSKTKIFCITYSWKSVENDITNISVINRATELFVINNKEKKSSCIQDSILWGDIQIKALQPKTSCFYFTVFTDLFIYLFYE